MDIGELFKTMLQKEHLMVVITIFNSCQEKNLTLLT